MSVVVNVTEEYITFEIINDGADDLKRFYTPEYFEHVHLNEYVEIYIQRAGTPKKSQKGGYFQDMSKLTIPYRYFAYVLDNNLVSDTIKQNDSPRTQFGKPEKSRFESPITVHPLEVKTSPHISDFVPSFLFKSPMLTINRKEEIKVPVIKWPTKASINMKEKEPRESLASTEASINMTEKEPRKSFKKTDSSRDGVVEKEPIEPLESTDSSRDGVVEKEPIEPLESTDSSIDIPEEKPEHEIIVLKCKRRLQEGMDGWFREVQDLENIDKDIELTTDGLYYDDLDQIYSLSKWLKTVPVCKEELYRINGRWLHIKSNSKADDKTSIDTLDKKNLPFPIKGT